MCVCTRAHVTAPCFLHVRKFTDCRERGSQSNSLKLEMEELSHSTQKGIVAILGQTGKEPAEAAGVERWKELLTTARKP